MHNYNMKCKKRSYVHELGTGYLVKNKCIITFLICNDPKIDFDALSVYHQKDPNALQTPSSGLIDEAIAYQICGCVIEFLYVQCTYVVYRQA